MVPRSAGRQGLGGGPPCRVPVDSPGGAEFLSCLSEIPMSHDYAPRMRLLTWNLGHQLNGGNAPDDAITALAALEPDIVILTERLSSAARHSFLASLAGLGLSHQLAPTPVPHSGHVLIASRLKLVPGRLKARTTREHLPSNMLHAYAPSGVLDVLGLRSPDSGSRSAARRRCREWLVRAATTLKHRRAILVGDFSVDADGERADGIDDLRQLTDAGWKHAVPSDGAGYPAANGYAGRLDHAFLSPSVQQIDARYALAAAGLRLTGTKEPLSDQPVLVVDLQ